MGAEEQKIRSLAQNRFLHGNLIKDGLCKVTGHSPYFCKLFVKEACYNAFGKWSTTQLTVSEFYDLCNVIIVYCAERDVIVKVPDYLRHTEKDIPIWIRE